MANPTTNYGFVLPTPTDLVTDLPADFDIALQGVDTRLKALQPGTNSGDLAYSSATANTNVRLGIGSNGQVLAVSGGVPAWTTTADVTPLTTKGDLFTFSTVDARLAVGTNGQVLTADSSEATGLKYATPAAGGKVLQVINSTFATQTSTASASFSDTGITATITPTLNTSKILVTVSFAFSKSAENAGSRGNVKFLRDSTTVNGSQTSFLRTSAATFQTIQYSTSFVDSPASTSALVYKMQFSALSSLGTITICEDNNQANIQLIEIGA